MTADIQHETSGLLAARVESFAEVIGQRDEARRERDAVEIERDALIARLNNAEGRIEAALMVLDGDVPA